MATTSHAPIKAEKWAGTANAFAQRELVLPKLFVRKGIEDFKGAKDDTLNMVVPGVLPAHDYAWRNDRANPIILDPYKERKVSLTFGGNAYSATELTDEQFEFDFKRGWADLLQAQGTAVARKLEHAAAHSLTNGTYAVTLGAKPENILKDIVEARRVLQKMGNNLANMTLVVGTDFEAYLQTEPTITQAMFAGDDSASSALRDATVGRVKGFNIVVSNEIPADEAYAMVGSSFVMLTAAPHVPQSGVGATVSTDGFAMRWLTDYDTMYQRERSVVNTWYGFQQVTDPVIYWDEAKGSEAVSDDVYGVRAVKLKLGGTDSYFAAGSDKDKVKAALGLTKRSGATTVSAKPGV